jgi:hypothetical protein
MVFRLIQRAARWVVPSGAAVLVLSLTMPSAFGQVRCPPVPCPPAPCPIPYTQPAPSTTPATPETPPAAAPAEAPSVDPLAFGATGGGESFAAGAPAVIGDGGVSGSGQAAQRASAYKIAENESPRPGNRVYFDYNYFNNVQGLGANVSRYMPGFEQTFAGGNASFGMRLPMFGNNNDGALGIQGFGNLNMIGKYAFINNPTTGTVVSSGALITAPTGRSLQVGDAQIRDWILQPYAGYILNGNGNLYLQGFLSLAVPTDARDIMILFNDVSAGYWIYRSNQDQWLTGVIPTIEGHLNTPLNHRGADRPDGSLGLQDSFVLTAGSHFVIRQRAMLTLGIATPLTGPTPFNVEGIAQVNYRY